MSLPAEYEDATWRCVTVVDPVRQRIGVGLDTVDGRTVRVALDLVSARCIADSLLEFLELANLDAIGA